MRGIHRSAVNFPHKGKWHGALMLSLICVWINGWVNNRKAGDLRRYRAYYDVIVISQQRKRRFHEYTAYFTNWIPPGPLFTKWTIILPQDLVKSRSCRDSDLDVFQSPRNLSGASAAAFENACQMSECYAYPNVQSRDFETSRDLVVTRPSA